ncbi:MAG: hypothetical protein ACE5JB_01155 [bacterium]
MIKRIVVCGLQHMATKILNKLQDLRFPDAVSNVTMNFSSNRIGLCVNLRELSFRYSQDKRLKGKKKFFRRSLFKVGKKGG